MKTQAPSATTRDLDSFAREWVKLEPKEFVTDVFIIQSADDGDRAFTETG